MTYKRRHKSSHSGSTTESTGVTTAITYQPVQYPSLSKSVTTKNYAMGSLYRPKRPRELCSANKHQRMEEKSQLDKRSDLKSQASVIFNEPEQDMLDVLSETNQPHHCACTQNIQAELNHVRLQLSKIEQDLLHSNIMCRANVDLLVEHQMAQIQHSQEREIEFLHAELDELRSDMCEVLKEMHLLKERSKLSHTILGCQTEVQRFSQPPENYTRLPWKEKQRRKIHEYTQDCHRDRCPCRTTSEIYPMVSTQRSIAAFSNPPVMPLKIHATLESINPCSSPHYSSRESSISGHISVTREEFEREEARLLEKHRLFWIGEGAGSHTGITGSSPECNIIR